MSKSIDTDVNEWISRNGWDGECELARGENKLWLAPSEWKFDEDNHFLYFNFGASWSEILDYVNIISLTESGERQAGLWLDYDTIKVRPFNKLFKEYIGEHPGLPLTGKDFFLPVSLDREELAKALEEGAIEEALDPLRATLDRLPELAARLEPLKRKIEAESAAAQS